ncbi:MAG: 1,4-dihydroxy-2-naphthoate polyprenyltransferase [Bacteroidetes Order II. Incertae sedis bacterium]|nr:1,4-dihydroxy-2-naphthoate polyprenyltransferase [Bacteroidetes Order II. bacterium]
MSPIHIWWEAIRPKTLPAALAPVLIGTTMAWSDGLFHAPSAIVAALGAVLIQIGTNLTNDYADFFKGADTAERKGPRRATQAGLLSANAVRNGAILAFSLAFFLGLYLVYRGGWPILLLGIVAIFSGITYTVGRYALAYTGLADFFVLVFFGPVAVGGTYYVQALVLPLWPILAGLGPGLLSVAILVVNNRRDMLEDAKADKKTLIVRFGRTFGNIWYTLCVVTAILMPIVLYLIEGKHPFVLLELLILIPATPLILALFREDGVALNPRLGATARLLLIYSLLFCIGWALR